MNDVQPSRESPGSEEPGEEARAPALSAAALARYWRRYWGFAVLLAWGGVVLGVGLVRFTPYHLAESSARALLLTWSFIQNIATPISLSNLPDLRALLLIPAAVYWPGSIAAAKMFSLLFAFAGVVLLYRWSARTAGRETALIASALMLVAPLMFKEADAVGAGPLLLLAFCAGAFLDARFRASRHLFGGWYFSQMLLVAFTVSLHPAGLAYPAMLAWGWWKQPLERRHQRYLYLGLIMAPLFVLMFRTGWVGMSWFVNPLPAAAGIFSGMPDAMFAGLRPLGLVTLLPGALLLMLDWRFLTTDSVGRMLLLGVLLGAMAADASWAMLLLALLVYRGTYHLIRLNEALPGGGLAGQRGLVLAALFIVATSFMFDDKIYARVISQNLLTPHGLLIQNLSRYNTPKHPIRAASQWPGETMIACKCYTLPLPPAAATGDDLLKSMKGIDYIALDPHDPANRPLLRNLAEISNTTETLFMDPQAGIIVKLRRGGNGSGHD